MAMLMVAAAAVTAARRGEALAVLGVAALLALATPGAIEATLAILRAARYGACESRLEEVLVHRTEEELSVGGQSEEPLGLRGIPGERLLAQDMRTGVECVDRHLAVQERHRADRDEVEVVGVEQSSVVVVDVGDSEGGADRGSASSVRVADGDHLDILDGAEVLDV